MIMAVVILLLVMQITTKTKSFVTHAEADDMSPFLLRSCVILGLPDVQKILLAMCIWQCNGAYCNRVIVSCFNSYREPPEMNDVCCAYQEKT
jgi:hypothetical protein